MLKYETFAAKDSKVAHLGLLTKPKLVGGLLGEGTEEDAV